MRYLSVCSGIEAATVAWGPLGWRAVAFAEIEKFPSAVLAHHYPDVPNLGDITKFKGWPDASFDVLVGGTPCQSFSVAGLRAGLADPRGNLALTYLAIADRYRPEWVVWENVPGVRSVNGGRDFGAFLGGLGQLGYGWAYRSLDAQYFGLAQRRERVFVVGHLGDWRRAAAVLFDGESLSGNPAPRREAGQRPAPTIASRPTGGGGLGTDFDCDGGLVSMTLNAHGGAGRMDAGSETFVTHALRADGFDASEDGSGRGTPLVATPIDMRQASRGEKITNNRAHGSGGAPGHGIGEAGDPAFTVSERGQAIAFSSKDHGADAGDLAPTLRAMGSAGGHANAGGQVAVAYSITPSNSNADFNARANDRSQALTGSGNIPSARGGDVVMVPNVRRLTPRECEALQGFPRNYTLVPYRGKPAADGPRYKALGNSMAVPVIHWIGSRIAQVAHLQRSAA